MAFELPPRHAVGVLDPEIAGEGEAVLMSDGETTNWTPPPARPVMPDWSSIKSLRKYFGPKPHRVWPAWLYHPKEAPRIVKSAEEAAQLGVCYRDATVDERGRYGLKKVWDWKDGCLWRPQPYGEAKLDPAKLGAGKTLIVTPPNPINAQNDLVAALIPAVAEAVARSLKATGPSAPANVDPKMWEEFVAFQAFRKTQEAVEDLTGAQDAEAEEEGSTNALGVNDERTVWIAEAERHGVKVDKRWGVERIKAEIDKAA